MKHIYLVKAWIVGTTDLNISIFKVLERCNKIESNRSDVIIIQLSTKLFLNYRYYNAYREIQTKFYYQKTQSRIMLIRREWLFRSVIPENYTKILDNVSTPKVFNKIQKVVSRPYIFYASIKIYVIERRY